MPRRVFRIRCADDARAPGEKPAGFEGVSLADAAVLDMCSKEEEEADGGPGSTRKSQCKGIIVESAMSAGREKLGARMTVVCWS